jgi:hypothetical protein
MIILFFFFCKVLISNSVSSLINGLLKWLDPQIPDSGSAPASVLLFVLLLRVLTPIYWYIYLIIMIILDQAVAYYSIYKRLYIYNQKQLSVIITIIIILGMVA